MLYSTSPQIPDIPIPNRNEPVKSPTLTWLSYKIALTRGQLILVLTALMAVGGCENTRSADDDDDSAEVRDDDDSADDDDDSAEGDDDSVDDDDSVTTPCESIVISEVDGSDTDILWVTDGTQTEIANQVSALPDNTFPLGYNASFEYLVNTDFMFMIVDPTSASARLDLTTSGDCKVVITQLVAPEGSAVYDFPSFFTGGFNQADIDALVPGNSFILNDGDNRFSVGPAYASPFSATVTPI